MTAAKAAETPVFWDCDCEAENLYHSSWEEAVTDYLGDREVEDWPEWLEVFGYTHVQLDVGRRDEWALESLLEGLDEDYLCRDASNTEPTEQMKAAAKAFVSAVAEEYVVSLCEPTVTTTVVVRDWINKHAPHWLEQEEIAKWMATGEKAGAV